MNDIDWLESMIPLATKHGAMRIKRIADKLRAVKPKPAPYRTVAKRNHRCKIKAVLSGKFKAACKAYAEKKYGNTDRADGFEFIYAQFCNYHESKGSIMASWDAAWRTWVQNDLKWAKDRASELERAGNGKSKTLVAVTGDKALRSALMDGQPVRMESGAYNAPSRMNDWVAVAGWYNDMAAREGWKGRIQQVVTPQGRPLRV